MSDTNDGGRTVARWLIQRPFNLRLATTGVAVSLALVAWRAWPSVAAGIALIYAIIAGGAIATGKSDLYEPGTTE
ncbi:hypothetical protein [Williamsia maris]|uniref:Uncharacterized protein n=1 Tax=Williamsia maris TaxID=72806 RepID=A0ABT1HJM3_9NOCA|nr:hypothetical protein [Williamsia maris]MCP2178140.1 hypothetical protein [Williamsia maris]